MWKEKKAFFCVEDNYKLYIFLLLTGILIIFGRTAHAIIYPVMYTEDGPWMSSLIYNGFIDTCINAKGSYLVVGNIIVLEIARIINKMLFGLNVVNLATILAVVSYVYYDLLAFASVFYLRKYLNVKARIFLFYMILMLPMGTAISEIYGRASNIGYGLFFLSFIIMLWFFLGKHGIVQKVINYVVLLVCCVTNPVCYIILAVILLYEFFSSVFGKEYKSAAVAVFIGVLAIVSLAIMYLNKVTEIGQVTETINQSEIIEYFFRSWIYIFIWPFYNQMNDKKALILLILFIAGLIVIWITMRKVKKYNKLLVLSYLTLILYTLVTLVSRKTLTWQLNNYSTTWPDRYFYVQNLLVLFIIAIFMSAKKEGELEKNSKCKTAIGYVVVYMGILICILPENIFEGLRSKCVETSATFGERISNAYYEQGEAEDYVVACPFTDVWMMKLPKDMVLASVEAYKEEYELLELIDLTDSNWEHGILRTGNCILFKNKKASLNVLENATWLVCNECMFTIVEVEEAGEYLRVYVEESLQELKWPICVEIK